MILRAILAALLVFGLAAPKAGWLIAHWALGAETLVICTGTKLVTLTLDAEGNPVEGHAPQAYDCIFAKGEANAPPVLASAPPPILAPMIRARVPDRGRNAASLPTGNSARAPPTALF